jgi:hypothetical protein
MKIVLKEWPSPSLFQLKQSSPLVFLRESENPPGKISFSDIQLQKTLHKPWKEKRETEKKE